ncbi:Cell division GTPase FtsZ [Halogranum gelatinilyticum]|uniref:Tubulin-like protein CetZ n=1 Tax=Halogranum gelatinilyticum TaxID=660521 RepID=A0A1G9X8U2_9EURY|nr:tubulin/FtsZ family protein [Halogranum gelatinilyticum]SDM92743.1 Cell division GTPase FtsZ [Halogranum gelatinilyticum]
MRLILLGVGQAGGKIVDRFLQYEQQTNQDFIVGTVALNTARADLRGLEHIPDRRRHLFGQTEVNGHGVGADNELATRLTVEDAQELIRATDDIPTSKADAFLVVAGLGGGTGSGAAPVIARELDRIYAQPIYGLGILPGTDEGSIYTYNAARSFQTFIDEVDNLLLFDNDAWMQSGEDVTSAYDSMNEKLVRRLSVIFNAGEVSGSDAVGESVVDSSEIINTLKGGGVTTIGFASSELPDDSSSGFSIRGLLGSSTPKPDEVEAVSRITTAARRAARGRLTLPADLSSTERALVVVSGPPAWLSRKGIEQSSQWLEEETTSMEIRGGDDPQPSSKYVSVAGLFSGVTDIPRLKQLQQQAMETDEWQENRDEVSEENLETLVEDPTDRLDSLF